MKVGRIVSDKGKEGGDEKERWIKGSKVGSEIRKEEKTRGNRREG